MPKYKKKYKFKYKVRWKNVFKVVAMLLAIIFIPKIINIIPSLYSELTSTKNLIADYQKNTKIINVVDDSNTIKVIPSETLSKFDPYYTYIKYSMIKADLTTYQAKNSDICGWIQIKNTNFNYPVVCGNKYKIKSINKKNSNKGWIYLSSLNETIDKNTIIYGNKYFAFNDVFDKNWSDDKNNYIVKFYNNYYTSLWQIVSIKKDTYVSITTDFSINNFTDYKDNLLEDSILDLNGTLSDEDILLTISSNSGKKDTIISAKLLKYKYFNKEDK